MPDFPLVQLQLEGRDEKPIGSRRVADKVTYRYRGGLQAEAQDIGRGGIRQWRWRLRNVGGGKSPAVTAFRPLYLELPCRGRLAPWLHGSRGGLDDATFPPSSWVQWSKTIASEGLAFTPVLAGSAGGRSANDHLPFFILEELHRHGGLILGVGWSGDWDLKMLRRGETCTLSAGMSHLELQLDAGESLLQPTILIGRYRGQVGDGQRLLRRHLRDHVQPQLDGRPMPMVSFWDNYYGDRGAFTERDFLEEIPLAAQAGFQYVVLDGGWTGGGQDGQFPSLLPHIGSWRPDPVRFPTGFAPIRAQAAAHGMAMGLWFDVEQAHPQSLGVREHPELFSPGGPAEMRLLRLDRGDALDWAFQAIADNTRALEARWLRLDFNLDPARHWAQLDGPGRRGAAQCRYLENLYRLNERILAAFPNVILENCASGGRRLDLELIRRCHTNWISDHTQSEAVVRFHLHGACRWLPGNQLNTSMAHALLEPQRPVDWRRPLPASAYLSHFGGNFSVSDRLKPLRPSARARLRSYVTLFQQTADCFAGEVFPLGQQSALYDGPAGLAALDRSGRQRAVLLFGETDRAARDLAPEPFRTLLRRPPLIADPGTSQFAACRLWCDPPVGRKASR